MNENVVKTKIGIITSQKAYPLIVEVAKEIEKKKPVEFVFVPLNVGVISLFTAEAVKNFLERSQHHISNLRKCDLVLVPGTIKGDVTKIKEILGVPVYKAGAQPSSLPKVVDYILNGKKLSTLEPADILLKMNEEIILKSILEEVYKNSKISFKLGDLGIPERPPPIVIAAETPVTLQIDELAEHARHLEDSGADIVIVGIPFGENIEESRRRIIAIDKELNSAVLGVDSANPKVLIEGALMGAELLLSLSLGNIDVLREAKNKAFVAVPGDPINGIIPKNSEEATSMLLNTVKKAKELGFENLIGDPILNPPGLGFAESVEAYRLSSARLQGIPLFAGLSNVVELFDADSPGLIALLVQLLGEIGVSVMLTSEESWKAKGSTLELRGASMLTSYSLRARAPPHNAGIDLLFLKEKEQPLSYYPPENFIAEEVIAEPPVELQKEVYFTIGVDYRKGKIVACVHKNSNIQCFEGKSARALYKKALSIAKEASPEHAAYLGYELSRAEIFLALGKPYVQDSEAPLKIVEKKDKILNIYKDILKAIKDE